MSKLLSIVSLVLVTQACANGNDSALSSTAAATERRAIECQELVDHGATVTFLADRESGAITRAIYEETDFFETRLVSEMGVCSVDQSTTVCHDVNWTNSYEVVLTEDRRASIPSIKLYGDANLSSRHVVHELECRYVGE